MVVVFVPQTLDLMLCGADFVDKSGNMEVLRVVQHGQYLIHFQTQVRDGIIVVRLPFGAEFLLSVSVLWFVRPVSQ